MNDRFKIFAIVAVLGFFAGVIADLTAEYVLPAIMSIFPQILNARYLLSGLAGAFLTLVLVSVWAYITGPTQK
jgi:hypothetical protein